MSESEAAFKALRRCWDEDVWLEELVGRFWRLTLQVLSRVLLCALARFAVSSMLTPRLVQRRSSAGTAHGSTTESRDTSCLRAPRPQTSPQQRLAVPPVEPRSMATEVE